MDRMLQIAEEQKYFDVAADARERSRETLRTAAEYAAGPQAGVRQVRKGAQARLASLGAPDDPVAFGRIDLEEDDQSFYIGYHAISDEQRDKLVVNWQADFVSRLWSLGAKDAVGELRRRRRFDTERNNVVDLHDEIFSDIAQRLEELSTDEDFGIDDALLHDINVARSGEMRDIVQTIQASQHDLLHHPLESLLIIQGGPGTGKSAVALHRASVLLFKHRGDIAPDDVLVIGPNPTFTGYIKGLLPSLGDEGVRHSDLRALGPIRSTGREEPSYTAKIKGEARMAELLRRALRARVRITSAKGLTVRAGTMNIRLDPSHVAERAEALLDGAGTYNTGRQGLRQWIVNHVAERTRTNQLRVPAEAIDQVLERIWPALTPQSFLWDLLGSRNRLQSGAGDDFSVADIDRIVRDAAPRVTEEQWSDTDVALLDEADRLINGSGPSFAHVIVDEAQDLSPMQLRSIRARSSKGSYTIVGDIAQSTGPWSRDSWQDVIQALETDYPVDLHELQFGYRVPEQIFELAARLLPHAAPSITAPRVVRRGPSEPKLLERDWLEVVDTAVDAAQQYAGMGRFVGIICAPEHRDVLAALLDARQMQYDDASSGRIGKSINLMTANESKGLEFDAVVVVEPAAIARTNGTGLRLLYIALTRATKALTISYSEPLDVLLDERLVVPIECEIDGPEANHESDSAAAVDLEPDENDAEPDAVALSTVAVDTPATTQPTVASAVTAAVGPRPAIVKAVATDLAVDIKSTLAPAAWPTVLDELARQLGLNNDADD